MLECDFCGCYSPRPEQGWVAYPGNQNPAIDEPGVLVYCPSCAEAVFNRRSAAAAEHICIWKPQASDSHGPRVEVTQADHSLQAGPFGRVTDSRLAR